MKKGMMYDFRTDFNDKGQFHGVTIVKWNNIRKKDPKIGTKQHQAQFDWEADTKICEAINNGRLKPFKDPMHQGITCCMHEDATPLSPHKCPRGPSS
jgi:hypothetical protein